MSLKSIHKNHGRIVLALLIIGGVIIYAYLGLPGFPGKGLNIWSISQVSIEPGGSNVAGKWKGTFWVVTGTVDAQETWGFTLTPKNMSGTSDGNTIKSKATITVTFTPQQPYYTRSLAHQTVEVVSQVHPATYTHYCERWAMDSEGNGVYYPPSDDKTEGSSPVIPQLTLGYYTFAANMWIRHTPFTVTVQKTGTDSDFTSTKIVDTIGGVEQIIIANPNDASQQLVITNCGQIDSGLRDPTIADSLIFDSGDSIHIDTSLLSIIGYDRSGFSYSRYLYGPARWADGTPEPTFNSPGDQSPSPYPGWTYTYQHSPATTFLPESMTYTYSAAAGTLNTLEAYLQSQHYNIIPGNNELGLNTYNRGYSIGNDLLTINIPPGSVSSIVTVKVSTELADSFVYQPQYGTFSISDASFSAGSELRYNTPSQLNVKVKCTSPGTFSLQVSSSTTALSINPPATSDTMATGDERTYPFAVNNLGVSSTQTGIVSITLKDVSGTVDDSRSIQFNLTPMGYTVTILVKGSSGSPISMAKVVLGGATLLTDSGGAASFSGMATGRYNFAVTKSGYVDYSGIVDVASDLTQPVTLTPTSVQTPTYIVTISIKDVQDSPISGASVILSGLSVTSDISGKAVFPGLASGTYSFVITKQGYSSISDNVVVSQSDVAKPEIMVQTSSSDPTGDLYINNIKIISSSPPIQVTDGFVNMKVILTSQQNAVTDVVMTITWSGGLKDLSDIVVSGSVYTASYTLPAAGSYMINAKITTNSKVIDLPSVEVDLAGPMQDMALYLGAVLVVLVVVAVITLRRLKRKSIGYSRGRSRR